MLADRASRVIDRRTLADQADLEIDPQTLADQANLEIDRQTLAARVDREIGPLISADPADREIVPRILADPVDREIDRVILAGLANQAEILSRTFQVASATARDGRIGARNIVTISETGGRIMPATSTIGSMTPGGMTMTSTGRTTQASVTGDGPHGTG
jgi:hypothetical protein